MTAVKIQSLTNPQPRKIVQKRILVSGGEISCHRGGVKSGQLSARPTCEGARSGPFACRRRKFFVWLRRGDFPGLGIDGRFSGWRWLFASARFRLLEPVAFAVHLQNMDMMGEAVEQGACEALIRGRRGCAHDAVDLQSAPFVGMAGRVMEGILECLGGSAD